MHVRTAGRSCSKAPASVPRAAIISVTGTDTAEEPALTPLRIEGSIRHPADAEPWEYTVVVTIRNDRGEEIARKLIGVGAMTTNEQRTVTLTVEAVVAKGKRPAKGGTRH